VPALPPSFASWPSISFSIYLRNSWLEITLPTVFGEKPPVLILGDYYYLDFFEDLGDF
jgi:hypothetical protein